MNRTYTLIGAVLILILAGAGMWYLATRATPDGTPAGTTPTPAAADVPQELSENGQYYDLLATYPSVTPLKASAGARADAEAIAVLKTFAAQQMARFKDNAGLDTLTPEDIAIQGLDQGRSYSLDMEYTAYVSKNTVSYVYSIYEDTLGAHPNGYFRTFLFDGRTGASLELGDLFAPGADYLTFLSERSRTDLAAHLGEYADTDYIASGTQPSEDSFQSFYLDGESLILLFPPYQVGPYAIGPQSVSIPLADVPGLKAEYK